MSRRRIPRLKRSPPKRKPKRLFVLYCEGKNTEPSYFRTLARLTKTSLVEVEIIAKAGVPKAVATAAVQHARELRASKSRKTHNSFEEDDEVWAVFDRDNHPHFDEAVKTCKENNVGVAQSNPCFEVWLILHFEEYHAPRDSAQVQRHLQRLMPEYNPARSKQPNCVRLMESIDRAEERAEILLQRRAEEGSPYGAPSTTVHVLTRAIRSAQTAK